MAECEVGEGTLTAAIVTQSSYALGANAKPFSVVIFIKLDKAVNARPDNITQHTRASLGDLILSGLNDGT